MKFKEWLKQQCIRRAEELKTDAACTLFDRLYLQDGTSLSVQASEYHFCRPRENLKDGDYSAVEIYSDGVKISEFSMYADYTGEVYKYVPVDTIEKYIEKHGGIKL